MIDESNPAGRLYKILAGVKSQPDKTSVKKVWASAFAIEENDVLITKSVVELYSLSQEIQSLIKMNDALNHDLYLTSFNKIDRSFFPLNLNATWASVKVHLTDEALTRLQFCANELSRFYSEESISEEDLKFIIQKTGELFETLYKSSLPAALRLSLLEEVERIRSAISLYKIKGAKGLKEALQGTLGAVVANQEELKAASKTDSDVIKRLGELIEKMDSFASKALKIKKALTSPVKYVLEMLSEAEDESVEIET
ncbi:hypothetical protein MT390_02975 [Vibrio sp. 2-Bac 85]